jgi:two-component system sensor histidine kinase HydH
MRQVVWNLLRNGMQATAAGSSVVVRLAPTEREALLSVDDQGPGIPPSAEGRIFDDFFTTRTHGAGIGLAVVRRIIDAHAAMGVSLAVRRSASGGASFQLTLSRDVGGLRRSVRPARP